MEDAPGDPGMRVSCEEEVRAVREQRPKEMLKLAGPGRLLSSKAIEDAAVGEGAQAQPCFAPFPPASPLGFPEQPPQHPTTSLERNLP